MILKHFIDKMQGNRSRLGDVSEIGAVGVLGDESLFADRHPVASPSVNLFESP